MDRLDHNGSVAGSGLTAAAAVGAGRRSPGRSPVKRSPTADSYGFPPGYQNDSFVSNESHRNNPGPYADQYGQQRDDYHSNQNLSPVYGAGAGYAQNQQPGRRSPGQGYNNQQYNAPGPRRSPTEPNPYANNYGRPDRSPDVGRGPSPISYQNDMYAQQNDSYAHQNDSYTHQNDSYSHQNANYAPSPVRTHSPAYANTSPVATQPQAPAIPAALAAPTAPAYPGQQTYQNESAAPAQPTYRAFTPAQNH